MKSQIIGHVGGSSKSADIYQHLLDGIEYTPGAPHLFIRAVMDAYDGYAAEHKVDRSVHGRVFEYVIGEALIQEGIQPLYYQAEVRHVPLATFDWFLYHPETPVSLSCKTKARDRWKQAAHEARSLKDVYIRATNYLVTIEPLSQSDDKLAQSPISIDVAMVATSPEFDREVEKIKAVSYSEARPLPPIITGKLVRPEGGPR